MRGTLARDEIIEVYETRMDVALKRNKVRHSKGWTPTHSPDGTAVLEQYIEVTLDDAPTKAAEMVNLGPSRCVHDVVLQRESMP